MTRAIQEIILPPIISSENLPLPRLQLTWKLLDEDARRWECRYALLIPVGHYDKRNEGPDGEIGAGQGYTEALINITTSEGGPHRRQENRIIRPFRDGAHASWDSYALKIPAYVVLDAEAQLIEPNDPND